LCRDAFSDDVRTASVHLNYPAPISKPAWWFQRVVPLATAPATYFATSVHDFGYGGIQQVDANTGRVIFSLWDQGGCDTDINPNCDPDDMAQTVACGEGVTCEDFGGEGTGRKSYYDREPFQIGVSYYFVTQAVYLGNKRMEYTGYFFEEGRWRLLSRIQVSTNSNEQWWLKGLYSFVEQWSEIDTTSDREAAFGPSYMADENGNDFRQIERGSFTHGTLENHERVNAWELMADGKPSVAIATGGDTQQSATMGDVFNYPDSSPYDELISFQGIIGCLNEANSRSEIEACLNDATTPNPPTPNPPTPNPPTPNPPTPNPPTSNPPSGCPKKKQKELIIEITTDNYGEDETEIYVEKRNKKGEFKKKFLEKNDFGNNESHVIGKCLKDKNSCYRFTILDSYGDGICCDYGNGSYKVTYGDELVRESSFEAGYNETATFGSGC